MKNIYGVLTLLGCIGTQVAWPFTVINTTDLPKTVQLIESYEPIKLTVQPYSSATFSLRETCSILKVETTETIKTEGSVKTRMITTCYEPYGTDKFSDEWGIVYYQPNDPEFAPSSLHYGSFTRAMNQRRG